MTEKTPKKLAQVWFEESYDDESYGSLFVDWQAKNAKLMRCNRFRLMVEDEEYFVCKKYQFKTMEQKSDK